MLLYLWEERLVLLPPYRLSSLPRYDSSLAPASIYISDIFMCLEDDRYKYGGYMLC